MAVDEDTVRQVAHLARVQIDPDRVAGYADEMSKVLALAEQMQAVDTEAVEAMAHPTNAVQRLREDKVVDDNSREQFQSIAPETEDGYYLVPQVIE